MKNRAILFSFLSALTLISLFFTGCTNYKQVPAEPFSTMEHPAAPDYAQLDNWAAHPTRDDYADGTPCSEVCDRQGKAMVDVFFLHPTTYYNNKDANNWNASVQDEELNEKTDETTIKHQSSIFNGHARVYAPRYRQASYGTFFIEDKKTQAQVAGLAYSDIARAFQHYLDYENEGRPIIIASHSQGSFHAIRLLQEFFDGKELQDQLVAAYVVGWPVFVDSFQVLKPCETPGETGCYTTWCTFAEGYTPDYYDIFFKGAVVTNPVNWTIDGTPSTREEHKGSVLRKYNHFYPNVFEAKAGDGVLFVSKPKNVPLDKKLVYSWKNYHIADYNLFWLDVRENVKNRAKNYLLDHPSMITSGNGTLPKEMFGTEETSNPPRVIED